MNSDKLNIVLDFSNLAMRSMFTCKYVESTIDIVNFDTEDECQVFINKLATDISYILRMFSPDRVIVACDGKSLWRKKLYDEIEGKEYKGTRERDDTKNWDNINNSLKELKTRLLGVNCIVSEIPAMEADDIAAYWKEELVDKRHESMVLISSDKDWTQLIGFNPQYRSFCACYNPIVNNKHQKKMYVTQDTNDWLVSPDKNVDIFFNNYDTMKKRFNDAISKDQNATVEIIDPDSVILDKVMCGDDGDNVPAIYDYYRNGKLTRVTPLKSKHILESLNIHNINELVEASKNNTLKEALEKEMKREIDVDMDKRVYRQRRLVELNSTLFPKDSQSMFQNMIESNEDNGHVANVSGIRADDILRDSRFFYDAEKKRKSRENGIFSDFKGFDTINPSKLF